MRLQASLGDVKYTERDDLDNSGKLTLAKVLRVNHRDLTVDVITIHGTYVGQDKGEEEEAINCLRLGSYAGFNDNNETSYGSVSPLKRGDLVVIGYLDSDKHKPILLGTVAHPDHTKNSAPEVYGVDYFEHEKDENYTVNNMQEFTFQDAFGQFEKVSHTGMFMVGKRDKMSDHRENGFNYEDLSIKNKWNYKTVRLPEEEMNYEPFNYLLVSKDTYSDEEETIYHRLYHDAEKGVTRFSKDGKDKLFFVELDDKFTVQYQPTSSRRAKRAYEEESYPHDTLRKSDHQFLYPKEPREDIPEFKPVEDFTRLEIGEDGSVLLKMQRGDKVTELRVTDQGPSLHSTENISIVSEKDISIMGRNVHIHNGNGSIGAAPDLDLREEDTENEWKREWVEPSATYGDRIQGD